MEIINYKKRGIIPLTQEEHNFYNEQEICYICKENFSMDKDDKDYINRKKVKDHCHYTGKFRKAAHSKCNLNYKIQKEILIIIHNASHFILNQLAIEFKGGLNCIGDNTEKYIIFSVPIKKELNNGKVITYKLKFIDSFRFTSDSLSNLVDNTSGIFNSIECKSCIEKIKINSECCFDGLKNNRLIYKYKECKEEWKRPINLLKEKFPSIHQFCDGDLNVFILVLGKGVYPYEYMDSWERFNETTLPPKEAFYSNLNLEVITDKDYTHAQKVWDVFEIKNLGEYHDLYIQSDTLLLSDVFENFRNMCLKIYELDPVYFVSVPGLAWQACLKKTRVKLELLTDYDMILMIEKGIKGGICQATYRYAKANNKYMKNYNKNIESPFIEYLDANNLYGWAMSQKLSVNDFKWIKKEELSNFNEDFIKHYDENGNIGYFLEVDIDYSKELFSFHKDLPFLPESKKVNKVEKLICSIENKEKYVIHTRALKQALDHGLVFKKVHRIIQFNQKAWLKEYINMNTELRKNVKNEFEKDFYKLINNSAFGKTMENIRNHRDIKLVTSEKRRKRLVSELNYHSCKKFTDDLMTIEMKKTIVKMNKPLHLGTSILDISKTLMYKFWYDYLEPKYRDRIKLLMYRIMLYGY